MNASKLFNNVIVRNLAGLLALLVIHLIADQANLVRRSGFNKTLPYLFLLLMYGWIVFHNRVLFERHYLQNRRRAYFGWTALAMGLSSLNMHYILKTGFNVSYTLPQILSFWVYTVTGLGVYVIWRYVSKIKPGSSEVSSTKNNEGSQDFNCMVDGVQQTISLASILYIESLENYIRIITDKKSFIVRLSLKEAEERFLKPKFIRISRSHLVNTDYITKNIGETLTIRDKELKVGKVYKRYVEEFLGSNSRIGN